MPTKDIVCLAYSRKIGGNCFAGIELATGHWIRAIGEHANGALSDFDCHMIVGNHPYTIPKPLDVIRIDFVGPEPKLAQPENWRVSKTQWQKIRPSSPADLETVKRAVADDPELFRGYDRYISSQDVEYRPPNCSLALLRPTALHWEEERDRYGRRRFRGRFTVSGAVYDLPLTCDEYAAKLTKIGVSEQTNGLSVSSDLLLSISLGDLYEETGRYYKLIAGVIEIPEATI
jgi:hypothetical protein